MQTEISWNSKN